MEVVDKLWRSWEPDAIVADPNTGVFADAAKVHTIDHDGDYYRCRGPLNMPAGPQGRPVVCQAGGSPGGPQLRGRSRRHHHRARANRCRGKGLQGRHRGQAQAARSSTRSLQGDVLRFRDAGRNPGGTRTTASAAGPRPARPTSNLASPRSPSTGPGTSPRCRLTSRSAPRRPMPHGRWWRLTRLAGARCARSRPTPT